MSQNKFFMDAEHLEYLVQRALPELIRSFGFGLGRPLMVWSAGCHAGEEAYTLAMVLSEFAERYPGLNFQFTVLATERSGDLLRVARSGTYGEETISAVPVPMRQKYLLKSRDRSKRLVRVVPNLKELVKFRKVHSDEADTSFREPMDIIFCRNCLTWETRDRHRVLLDHFHRHLVSGGYLFVGDSSRIESMNVPLVPVAPTIYRKLAD